MIVGRSLAPIKSSRTSAGVHRRLTAAPSDDNSRGTCRMFVQTAPTVLPVTGRCQRPVTGGRSVPGVDRRSGPQPHPSFIGVLGEATLGDGHGPVAGAGQDGAEVTA